jgi:DNA repair exonuclease SbcCD ATPase subunit
MRIRSVEWRNFNSYGNSLQHIDFEENSGDLYLLLGGNGHGKSTIAEVITFALYGKIERKNKSDLPNRLNKNLWCRIVIRSKNKIVEIIRGVSPNLFEVKIDGVSYDTAGTSNVQDYLELEISDIPFQVFKNIIVLSVNDFRSFLTMSTGDKRNIIDRLFGFSIINQMKDMIKNERKDIRERMKTLIDELAIIEDSIGSINTKIKNLEETKKEDNLKLVQEYKEKILGLIEDKKKTEEDLQKISSLESKINSTFEEKKSEITSLGYELKSIDEKIKLYENSQCPTCGSSLETEHHHEEKNSLIENKNSKTEKFNSLKDELAESQKKVKSVSDKVKELDQSIYRIKMLITQYKNEVEKTLNETKELDFEYLNQLRIENLDKKDTKKRNHTEISFDDSFLETVEAVLGEDGVKNLAMKTILPSLNQSISNMAKQMHLPYTIRFNDKFDCIINSLGEEINPRSMSTGERKKADFIIIIALLKILKIRYPSLNILFLDEIFSSVDSAGVYEIIKILRDVSKENHLNTWVINHTELPMELFDKRVEVYKEGGFSKLMMENIT